MTYVTSDPAISLDGFIAGPEQDLEHPLGVGGEALHVWHRSEHLQENAAEADAIVDAERLRDGPQHVRSRAAASGTIDWRGWWGDDPPYHAPVFVLTHHPREPIEMDGGTTFHFVTDGIEEALRLRP